jgi:hypothetical protein
MQIVIVKQEIVTHHIVLDELYRTQPRIVNLENLVSELKIENKKFENVQNYVQEKKHEHNFVDLANLVNRLRRGHRILLQEQILEIFQQLPYFGPRALKLIRIVFLLIAHEGILLLPIKSSLLSSRHKTSRPLARSGNVHSSR